MSENPVHERIGQFHAEARQEGQQQGSFPDDDMAAVAEEVVEGQPGEGGGEGDEEDVEADLDIAELEARDLGDDDGDLFAGEV